MLLQATLENLKNSVLVLASDVTHLIILAFVYILSVFMH